jgi:CRISPR system Cascade subunit CasC
MFVEMHMIQNFAPSCLNRDDTNAPKDCEFGGYRRARISSQCLKRAIRQQFKELGIFDGSNLSMRTKGIVIKVVDILKAHGKSEEESLRVAKAAFDGIKVSSDDEGKTQYLLFLSDGEVEKISEICLANWDKLTSVTNQAAPDAPEKSAKKKKAEKKDAIPIEVAKAIKDVLKKAKGVDLALFGRMLADNPDLNVDAASQVAHAISTHKVTMDMDFFTAVDDLQKSGDTGAGMMGTIEFNSACFYRYSLLDLSQLQDNLQSDQELAKRAVEGFIKASAYAIPTGKQTSMAAHNLPSFILVIVRESGQPFSLANAFADPVNVRSDKTNLITGSIDRLDEHLSDMLRLYGTNGILSIEYCSLSNKDLKSTKISVVKKEENLDALIKTVGEITNASPAPSH